ncbi:hypothetical protein [Mesorhizobium sp. 1M-11]|uniref:hypothetical protein n=1 Tax=Mesorhizobium sp. 1M-11 TaxID=1529006 RepID=UPI0006C7736C|nr:hypothetical protein [Mesorhizobium sp. 1M-11]
MEAFVSLPEHATLKHRRLLAARRVERERLRMELLSSCLNSLNRAAELRAWIQWVGDRDRAEPTVQRMLAWAKSQASILEAQAAVEVDQTRFGDLFPEADDLHDPLGDPAPKHAWGA